MAVATLLLASIFVVIGLQEVFGHGMVMDPVSRSSAWREEFNTPKNYNDNSLYCGGISVQHINNKGKCGVCGDDYAILPRPRPNENGGTYGTGTIVQTYKSGQRFTAKVQITANHMGYFKFAVCPLSHPKQLETEECFDAHPVKLADGSDHYNLAAGLTGLINIELALPRGLTCKHCVFRWHWKCGNNSNKCPDGKYRVGCGDFQENWRTCSDIKIE